MGNFQYVDLSSNRIDRSLSQDLISQLGKVKIINLSHNRIGKIACDRLSQMFFQPKTQIQQLYLQDNNLMDNAGASLLKGLSDYNFLRVLDLSKNFMSTRFAQQLKQYLIKDRSLQQLYLGWNQIGDKSAKLIFQALCQHTDLKVFDYSWNVIGVFSVPALQKLFKQNQSLIHIDISFCDIDKKHTQTLSKSLQQNHTIYGLHYQGNSGYIDNKGYLKQTQKQHREYPLPIIKGLIRKINSIHPNQIHNQYKSINYHDVCWICDNWQEVYIKIKNQDKDIKECYVHVRSQGWRAVKMEVGDGYFQMYRMLNMGDVQFFFTFNKGPGQKQHFVSPTFPTKDFNTTLQFSIGDLKLTSFVPKLNHLSNQFSQDIIDENYFPNIHCIPRSQQVRVNYSQQKQVNFKQIKKVLVKKKIKRQQKLKMKYRQLDQNGAEEFLRDSQNKDDDQEFVRKCLEFDIANSKICKLVKQQDDLWRFKNMMMQYYKDFKDGFYYLAKSYPALNGVYSVSEIAFQQFLEEQKYITKRVTLPKIMLKMYSCLSIADQDPSPQKRSAGDIGQLSQNTKKATSENRLFCRPQFLQFLIRLAIQKWCTAPPKQKKPKPQAPSSTTIPTKIQQEAPQQQDQPTTTKKQKLILPLPLIQGIQRTIKTMSKYSSSIRASIWRKQKYLTIDIYTVIKGYQSFLNDVFEKYSQNKKKLDKPKKLKGLLTLDQFKTMLIDADIKRTKEAAKDCQMAFLEAKRLEVEDGYIQYGLNFNQFCQCLARYSQILWYPPASCQKHELWQIQPLRRYIPLFIRFQSLIIALYRKLLQFQNRRMNKLCEYGLFIQQSQILIQKIKDIDISSTSDLAYKMNNLEQEDSITLRDLIQGLKDKYRDAVVEKEEEIEEEEDRVDD